MGGGERITLIVTYHRWECPQWYLSIPGTCYYEALKQMKHVQSTEAVLLPYACDAAGEAPQWFVHTRFDSWTVIFYETLDDEKSTVDDRGCTLQYVVQDGDWTHIHPGDNHGLFVLKLAPPQCLSSHHLPRATTTTILKLRLLANTEIEVEIEIEILSRLKRYWDLRSGLTLSLKLKLWGRDENWNWKWDWERGRDRDLSARRRETETKFETKNWDWDWDSDKYWHREGEWD